MVQMKCKLSVCSEQHPEFQTQISGKFLFAILLQIENVRIYMYSAAIHAFDSVILLHHADLPFLKVHHAEF